MLHYRNAGISYQENSARIDIARASFASLPGELRNLTYASTLKSASPITITYNETTRRFQNSGVKRVDSRTPLDVLQLLSNLDHNIRCEARSYFFASNVFQIETKQSVTTDVDYIETYITFLENIGEVGRRSLRWLRLTVNGDSKQHRPTLDRAVKLWDLVGDCANLLTLDIYLEIDYFYMDQQAALKMYMSTEGCPISHPWPEILKSIQNLTNLKRLVFRPVFSSRWRYFDLAVNGKLSTPTHTVREDLHKVRFRIRRPLDEAAELSDQVKGYVRQGLRGTVSVRVLTTETWEQYGADVIVGRESQESEVWTVQYSGICKPYGRYFNYSNGFKEG